MRGNAYWTVNDSQLLDGFLRLFKKRFHIAATLYYAKNRHVLALHTNKL
jgi:hypothetical protein